MQCCWALLLWSRRRAAAPPSSCRNRTSLRLAAIVCFMLSTIQRSVRGSSAFGLIASAPKRQNIKISLLVGGRRQQLLSSIVGLYSSSTPLQSTTTYECLFDIQVPEGRCVGLRLPDLPEDHPDSLTPGTILGTHNQFGSSAHQEQQHWIYNHLHADEVQYGLTLSSKTQASFWIGRMAMREALSDLNPMSVSTQSILKDSHGRPQLPAGILGSISHKRNTGVALVAPLPEKDKSDAVLLTGSKTGAPPRMGIGVDIEETTPKGRSVARKVLTPNEQRNLGLLPNVSPEEEVLLRFGLKESIYKAMHPLICQYVGFMEAEVQPLSDGTAAVTFQLKSGVHEQFGTVTAHWQRIGDFFLSTASVRLLDTVGMVHGRRNDGSECSL